MTASIRRMRFVPRLSRSLKSPVLSVILTGIAVFYMVGGKREWWPLDPRMVLAFAGVLCCHVAVLAVLRTGALVRGMPFQGREYERFRLLETDPKQAAELLESGKLRQIRYNGGCRVFAADWQAAVCAELAACGAGMAILVLGGLNYGFSINGQFDLSPSRSAETRLASLPLSRGFLVSRADVDYRLRASELTNAGIGKPAVTTVHIAASDGTERGVLRLKQGESFRLGKMRVQFTGEFYLAFVRVLKENHDYLAKPAMLTFQPDGSYAGELEVTVPGVTGVVTYEPGSGRFGARISKDGKEVYRDSLEPSRALNTEDLTVSVPAHLYAGRFIVSQFTYRGEIIGCMVLFLIAIMTRFVLRPKVVIFRDHEGKTYYWTNQTRLMLIVSGEKTFRT